MSFKLKTKIRAISFDNDPSKFLKNLLYPVEGYEIEKDGEKLLRLMVLKSKK